MDIQTQTVIKIWFKRAHGEEMLVDRMDFEGNHSEAYYSCLEEILMDYDCFQTMYFPIRDHGGI